MQLSASRVNQLILDIYIEIKWLKKKTIGIWCALRTLT